MPAEWRTHEATWLAWPKDPITWPDRVALVQNIFLEMISRLSAEERVELLVDDGPTEQDVRNRLGGFRVHLSNVRFHRIPTVDSWIRDYGPNFLLNAETRQLAFNHWIFNAWGGKYEELKRDTDVPFKITALLDVPRFTPGIVLEGGSIEVNGAGICMTTEQCLLNPNRNPDLSRADLEGQLRAHLGVSRILWLGEGIIGDDTDGHIDDIARFVRSDTIVAAVEDDPADENYKVLQDNLRRLECATDLSGKPFNLVLLPMPGPVEGSDGRLPASYANFYIANGTVLVPLFGHRNDEKALEILRSVFPGRTVAGLHCEPLVWGLGTIHCVTQQQPGRGW